MNTQEVTDFAENKIAEYLKLDWKFTIKHMRALGQTRSYRVDIGDSFKIKSCEIFLNKALVKQGNEEIITQTILHEVAHAIQVEAIGKSDHGPMWQALASKIGVKNPAASTTAGAEDVILHAKYIIECLDCGAKIPKYRKTKDLEYNVNNGVYHCIRCENGGDLILYHNY